ncbi:MAG: hypothetical protein [Circular genetic element sp.]|nr:MAG: hypothetical protein [Circular genetic element sp.]
MGTHKQNDIERKSRKKLNPYERALLAYTAIAESIAAHAEALFEAMEDDHKPLIGINLKRMDHGGWLAIAVRDNDMVREDVLTGGQDPVDALIMLSKKIKRKGFKVADVWPPLEK